MRSLLILVFCLGLALAKHENYDGSSVYKVTVASTDEVQILNKLEALLDIDVWSHATPNRPGFVLVSAQMKAIFETELKAQGIKFKIERDNVKDLLELEDMLLSQNTRKPYDAKVDPLPFDRILTYAEVDAFLEMIAESYPDTVTLVNAGTSFEGRDIKYLKISTTNFEDTLKPVVFIESLLHAREWITLPATLYAIQKLVIDVTEQDLLQDIDWIILPVANPDGYVFTHVENRFWRKNRATGYSLICQGVDLNRNFDVDWSEASSNFACMDNFHGANGFSEPETAIIRNIFLEHQDRIELFLDIHSFGSMILYGYGTGQLPSNALFLHLVGVNMAQAIDAVKMRWNSDYIVGNVAHVLYAASGSAQDYAKAVGIPYSYTYELPGHRFGLGTVAGFLVSPDFIEQAGFETWEGIKTGARYVRDNYRRK